ncbi:antiterminator [Clostridium baratii]|uniref:glycerol-3-phosphate responsive antiterminator n=1 Tax=Clostridium baratii TaxID=1561 RepID=UPI0009A405F4|nr:glycerol-3-phosphate responsive antiterminator [Clostridium baratii]OPF50619.1 antiterminator [Clostridium baratii]OPF54138.1 antiterminator [Clostridium baratii]OPF58702.1 antiterminator [Clostridium baratii]OPF58926.1 antiterminator [Clostridium baratii]
MNFNEVLENNPVIAAVKNFEELNIAINSNIEIIFVLFGDVLNVKEISEIIDQNNKIGIVHIDLIEGLNQKEAAVKYLKKETKFKGIISTKSQAIRLAKENGFIVIQRSFVFDTISLENVKNHLASNIDAIEILPGLIPKVIEELTNNSSKPIICGGLIETKDEVMMALSSGASSVSTTKREIWEM